MKQKNLEVHKGISDDVSEPKIFHISNTDLSRRKFESQPTDKCHKTMKPTGTQEECFLLRKKLTPSVFQYQKKNRF